MPYLTTRKKT